MADLDVSTPEDRAGADQPPAAPPRHSAPDSPKRRPPMGSSEQRPRPRTRPPSSRSPAAPRTYESQSLSERILPPLFFAFLLLTVVGCAVILLWNPSAQDEYVLSSEELSVLRGSTPPPAVDQTARTSVDPVGDAVAETAGLRIETVLPGVMVSIDGEVLGVTPLQVRNMQARWHIVTLERPGFTAIDTLVYLQEDAVTSLSLELTPRSEGGATELAAPDERLQNDRSVESTPPAVTQPAEDLAPAEPPRSEEAPARAPAYGSISVAVNPAGVPIQLDGQTVGVAPIELNGVEPGARTLTFFLPGYETATVRLDVEPGVNEVVDIALVPQTGTLVVVARPWGAIYVNGELRAQDTDVSVEVVLPVGNHQVRVVHPSLGAQERTVEVQPEATTMASFNLN